MLCYSTDVEDTPRIVVPHDEELKYRILYEAHDTAVSGHFGREKTCRSEMPILLVAQTLQMGKHIRAYV